MWGSPRPTGGDTPGTAAGIPQVAPRMLHPAAPCGDTPGLHRPHHLVTQRTCKLAAQGGDRFAPMRRTVVGRTSVRTRSITCHAFVGPTCHASVGPTCHASVGPTCHASV